MKSLTTVAQSVRYVVLWRSSNSRARKRKPAIQHPSVFTCIPEMRSLPSYYALARKPSIVHFMTCIRTSATSHRETLMWSVMRHKNTISELEHQVPLWHWWHADSTCGWGGDCGGSRSSAIVAIGHAAVQCHVHTAHRKVLWHSLINTGKDSFTWHVLGQYWLYCAKWFWQPHLRKRHVWCMGLLCKCRLQEPPEHFETLWAVVSRPSWTFETWSAWLSSCLNFAKMTSAPGLEMQRTRNFSCGGFREKAIRGQKKTHVRVISMAKSGQKSHTLSGRKQENLSFYLVIKSWFSTLKIKT